MPEGKKTRILAIDPGTREIGIAVLDGGSLVYIGVETIPKNCSPHDPLGAGRQIVTRLIKDFRPKLLAIEKSFFVKNCNTTLLNELTGEIRSLGRRAGLSVVRIAPNVVKKVVAGNGWATKEEVARAITVKYPKLKAYLPPDRKWKRRLHYNMFDAVALGVACLARWTKDGSPFSN